MAIYEARCVHHRKAYIKGDLESEDVLHSSETFTTRKAANSYLQRKESDAKRRGNKTRINLVGRGDKESELVIFTGNSWINENTGDEHEEYYWYRVINK